MDEEHTTAVVQRYLDELRGDARARSQPSVLLLDRAVQSAARTLRPPSCTGYPRLAGRLLNLQADELLGAR